MTVVLDISVPASDFVLEEFLRTYPETRIEFERVVSTDNAPIPFLYAPIEHSERIRSELNDEPLVESITTVETTSDRTLWQVRWNELPRSFLSGLVITAATVLSGGTAEGRWRFQLRLMDHERAAELQEHCVENDISWQIHQISNSESFAGGLLISDRQYETLSVAARQGYFEIPRKTSLTQIAEQLSITENAVSECLRRAEKQLCEQHLTEQFEYDPHSRRKSGPKRESMFCSVFILVI